MISYLNILIKHFVFSILDFVILFSIIDFMILIVYFTFFGSIEDFELK